MAGICTGPGPCDVTPIGEGKNWVNKVGGLPLYIRAIAQALIRNGHSESEAIQIAVGTVQRWARGEGKVTPATRTRAAAALAEWERKKAQAHVTASEGNGMADRHGIEIARVGNWELASGPLTVTQKMLADAAERATAAGANFRAPIKLGHTDERFDGEPAMGWLNNLRVEGDGDDAVLKGDISGMPEWLAEVEPTAYPDRSVEGLVYGEDGFEVTGLALLGVTPPGMSTIKSLRDLPAALGVEQPLPIAASFKASGEEMRAAESVSSTPWSNFSASDYTPAQYKAACLIVTGDGSTKDMCSLPIREPDGTLNRNGVAAAAGRLKQTDASPSAKAAAAKVLLNIYRNTLHAAAPADVKELAGISASGPSSPAEPPVQPPKGADEMSDTDKGLRERLGLPEDADDDVVNAKVDELLELATKPEPPKAEPPAVPAGSVVINSDALEELKIAASAGQEARKVQLLQERDETIGRAIKAGKIAPARKDHWATNWDKDPEGVKAAIAELTVVYPVAASGYVGDSDGIQDDDDALLRQFNLLEPEKVGA